MIIIFINDINYSTMMMMIKGEKEREKFNDEATSDVENIEEFGSDVTAIA